tara:strand:+ start:210 stop:446 length:237 start_codon:yes stop_codon:yes gene_type:complete
MSEQTFDEWKEKINSLVKSKIQINIDELPDMTYRNWYNNNNLEPDAISYIILGEYYKSVDKQVQFCKELLVKSNQCLT